MRDVNGQTIAYSTTGSSTHIAILRFISEYGIKATPVATGEVTGTITQVMSGQVDVGWSVAPFVLGQLHNGEARMIARASDIAVIRGQTIRVQIMNAQNLAYKLDLALLYEARDGLAGKTRRTCARIRSRSLKYLRGPLRPFTAGANRHQYVALGK